MPPAWHVSLWLAAIAMLLLSYSLVGAAELSDPRICGVVLRDNDGKIHRSRTAMAQFQHLHPCPETGSKTGACPGWAIDHVIPLACGGCDSPINMQWLKTSIKSCSGTDCKDRWERKIYCEK